jgi:hypothetical protein
MEAHTGAFDTEYFTSRSMKEYIGAANGRRGLAFNKSVAAAFESEGWRALIEVPMTQLRAPRTEASGDIDVLAIKDGTVYVSECKELLFARTIAYYLRARGMDWRLPRIIARICGSAVLGCRIRYLVLERVHETDRPVLPEFDVIDVRAEQRIVRETDRFTVE